MLPITKKFNANVSLYDSVGSEDVFYYSSYNSGRYIYFLNNQVTGEVTAIDTLNESTSTIYAECPENTYVQTIVEKNGVIYGFNGCNAKEFTDDTVLYVYQDNVLREESYDRVIKRTHLSSATQITDFAIDDNSNYYVIHAKNKISKFNKYRIPQFTLNLNPSSTEALIPSLSVLPTDQISLMSMDFIAEYIGQSKQTYPVVLGLVDRTKQMFLLKMDENFTQVTGTKYIGLTGEVYPMSNIGNRVIYNLTNYDYLRRKYTANNELTFSLALRNLYDPNDRISIDIPIDVSLFTTEDHHFSIKLDGINGVVSVYVDGSLYKEVSIDSSKYIFQQIFEDGLALGSTYFFNNVTLNEHLGIPNAYMTKDATVRDFRIYNKSLTDTEIKFNMYHGIDMHDITISLPADQRNQIEIIETQFKLGIPGFKSNNINLIIKNISNIDSDKQEKLKTAIADRLSRVMPNNTKIKNIKFV